MLAFAVTSVCAQEGEPVQPAEQQQKTETAVTPSGDEQVPAVKEAPAADEVQTPSPAREEAAPVPETELIPAEEPAEESTGLSPEEEEQIDRTIDEAMGNSQGTSEASGTMEEEWVQEPVVKEETVVKEEAVPLEEPAREDRYDRYNRREVKTLMTGSGGYGAIDFGYTQVNNLNSLQMGARAAWIVGHGFGLGIAGTGFTSDFTPVGEDYYAISGGYGGLLMEPIIVGWFPVNIAFPVVIGGGGLASYATNADPWNYDNVDPTFGEYSSFFIAEVGVELQFNLVRFFRFTMFGTYRWTTDLEMKPMYGLQQSSDYPVGPRALEGWSAGIRFKFGSF